MGATTVAASRQRGTPETNPITVSAAPTTIAAGVKSIHPPARYTRAKNGCTRRLETATRSRPWKIASSARSAGWRRFRASAWRRRDAGRSVSSPAWRSLAISTGIRSTSKVPNRSR